MKIKNIAAICKKSKIAHIYQDTKNEGVQWIGTDMALYQINNLPDLDRESLLTIFDIPEKQKDKWVVLQMGEEEISSLEDVVNGETAVDIFGPEIGYHDMTLLPLRTQTGVVFVDSRKLSPLSDMLDVISLYERKSPSGRVDIAVKAGMMLKAILVPEDIVTEDFVANLKSLAHQCDLMLERQKERYQIMRIDTRTGEIMQEEKGYDESEKCD